MTLEVGRARSLFEAAYDEHARRLAKLYANLGLTWGRVSNPPGGP